jgi:hypothetical protein
VGDGNPAVELASELAPDLIKVSGDLLRGVAAISEGNEPVASGGASACLSVMLEVGVCQLNDLLGEGIGEEK